MFKGCVDFRSCSCLDEEDDRGDDWYLRGVGDGQTTMMTGQLRGKMRSINVMNGELNAIKDLLDAGVINAEDYHARKRVILAQAHKSGEVGGYAGQGRGTQMENGVQQNTISSIELVNFYSKHDPSKVPKVDVFLESLSHKKIDARLLEKYGVSVWHPNGITSSISVHSGVAKNAPAALSPQADLMQKRQKLLAERESLQAKMNSSKNSSNNGGGPTSPDSERKVVLTQKALEDFYAIYSPERVGRVGQILDKTRGQESELVVALRSKYGAAPQLQLACASHAPSPRTSPPMPTARMPTAPVSPQGTRAAAAFSSTVSQGAVDHGADEPESIRLLRAEKERLQRELQRMNSDTQQLANMQRAHQ
jgi:hypothetical protein